MKYLQPIITLLFGVAVVLFFGMAYPHHLHYQEQFQLFLFDSTYLWDVVKHPGGVADLLGRFCTQFFLYAWVGAVIIGVLLVLVQLLTFQLVQWSMVNGQYSMFNAFSFVPSFLLWLFLLDENALMGGVWAVLFLLLAVWGVAKSPKGWKRYTLFVIAIALLYLIASPTGHYYRNPVETPTLLWAAYLSAIILPLLAHVFQKRSHFTFHSSLFTFYFSLFTSAVVTAVMGSFVWKNANFKAEKVMQYDFMARHQQWNRILNTINTEKPNNQIGVVVQNLALAMNGLLVEHLFDFNQNGDLGLLPDVGTDATSPLPIAEAFYQLGMIRVAQRTVFEAQEAILDYQKSGRCYKRLAQTYLILGDDDVARKYLKALQKTLFYREWANETLSLLGNEQAIAKHPEYGRLRKMNYKEDFLFSSHMNAEMLERLFFSNTDNRLALEYLRAYYVLTNDRENYVKLLQNIKK